jgi:hypothetical protein
MDNERSKSDDGECDFLSTTECIVSITGLFGCDDEIAGCCRELYLEGADLAISSGSELSAGAAIGIGIALRLENSGRNLWIVCMYHTLAAIGPYGVGTGGKSRQANCTTSCVACVISRLYLSSIVSCSL